jgi:hypothetical protein
MPMSSAQLFPNAAVVCRNEWPGGGSTNERTIPMNLLKRLWSNIASAADAWGEQAATVREATQRVRDHFGLDEQPQLPEPVNGRRRVGTKGGDA